MSDLKNRFEACVASSTSLSQRPDNSTLLQLYALYKQATEGDVATPKPGFSDMVGRFKWDAWSKLKGVGSEDAMQRYIDQIESLR